MKTIHAPAGAYPMTTQQEQQRRLQMIQAMEKSGCTLRARVVDGWHQVTVTTQSGDVFRIEGRKRFEWDSVYREWSLRTPRAFTPRRTRQAKGRAA